MTMVENSVVLDNQTLQDSNSVNNRTMQDSKEEDSQYLKPEQAVKRKVLQIIAILVLSPYLLIPLQTKTLVLIMI